MRDRATERKVERGRVERERVEERLAPRGLVAHFFRHGTINPKWSSVVFPYISPSSCWHATNMDTMWEAVALTLIWPIFRFQRCGVPAGGAPGRALKQESNGSCVSKTITIWPFLYSSPGCAFLLAILTSSLFLFMSSCAHVFRRRPKPNHSFVNLQKEGTQRHLVGRKTKLGREGWRTKQFVGGG